MYAHRPEVNVYIQNVGSADAYSIEVRIGTLEEKGYLDVLRAGETKKVNIKYDADSWPGPPPIGYYIYVNVHVRCAEGVTQEFDVEV